MRRSIFKIIVQINNMFIDYPDLPFSIRSVANHNDTSWRTARSCLETLVDLRLISKSQEGKWFHYINRKVGT